MRRSRAWMLGVMLCRAAAAAAGEVPADARLREAQAALDEAHTSWEAGRYAEAIARGEQAQALREAVLGGSHPDVATCLHWLGAHHLLQGNPVRAEPLLQRALALREAALGPRHPEVAQTLNTLAQRGCTACPRARRSPRARSPSSGPSWPLFTLPPPSTGLLSVLYLRAGSDGPGERVLCSGMRGSHGYAKESFFTAS